MIEVLSQPFFQNALMAGVLVALMCSFLGVYVLLKRVVFVGFALSQIASAGVAAALLVGTSPLLLALVFSLGGVAFFSETSSRRRIPMEGVIGASYILAAAAGIICVAKNPVGEARALRILFGNILSVETGELVALVIVFTLIALVHFLFYKEFLFVSFDFETARVQGLNARWWNLLLYLTLGFAIAVAIRSMGVLLVFAFLVAPPITARLVADRMRPMFLWAMAFGALSVPTGLSLAFAFDLPTGTAIAATTMAILLLVLLGRFLASETRLRRALAVLAAGTVLLASTPMARAATGEADMEQLHQEMQSLKEIVRALKRQVEAQAETIRRQDVYIQELRGARGEASTPASQPSTPGEPPASQVEERGTAKAIGAPLQLGGLVFNPEMRVEGNFIYNKTFGDARRKRQAEFDGFDEDRLSLKEVELGFRSAVDPYARFEAIISGKNLLQIGEEGKSVATDVELEEAFLTLTRLPQGIQAKLGRFRTGFGEFNDRPPEEFPQVDAPNVIVNLFGSEGDGWVDTGITTNYQFGNPWTDDITHLAWFAVYNGDNDVAFQGGRFNRPVYFGRFETFFEVGPRAGMELGLAFATGHREEEGTRLRTTLANVHWEYEYRDPILVHGQAASISTEFFLADVEDQTGGTTRSYGGYVLGQYLPTPEWSIGARFDWSECPGLANSPCRNNFGDDTLAFVPGEGREWAISPILIYKPSRFLEFRAQYKHTDRNFDSNSDEIMLQSVFIIGFERPEPF